MTNFTSIIITNVTTQIVVKTLPFNAENEKVADAIARKHNVEKAMMGLLSVHYK